MNYYFGYGLGVCITSIFGILSKFFGDVYSTLVLLGAMGICFMLKGFYDAYLGAYE